MVRTITLVVDEQIGELGALRSFRKSLADVERKIDVVVEEAEGFDEADQPRCCSAWTVAVPHMPLGVIRFQKLAENVSADEADGEVFVEFGGEDDGDGGVRSLGDRVGDCRNDSTSNVESESQAGQK